MTVKLHQEDRVLFMDGITYLDYARNDLAQAQVDARVRRLYRAFFRPSSLFFLALFLGLFSALGMALRLSGSLSFSVGLLLYVSPLLRWVWTKRGEEDLRMFLENVHRSDKSIMDLGRRELLAWATQHPEELMEEGAEVALLESVVLQRQQHLEEYYRATVRGDEDISAGSA